MRELGNSIGLVAAAVACLGATTQVRAETLADAIELAYSSNPDLQQVRADLRSVDESYVQARAGWQPQLDLSLTGQYNKGQSTDFFGNPIINETNTGAAALTLTQPLYTGGLVTAKVKQAISDINGQRQTLRSAEANVVFQVISAYQDVLRDQQALEINRNALAAFGREVDEINARLRAGELTRTDVAQAQAQFQNQQAVANTAAAQLQLSVAAYVAAVGQNPSALQPPPPLPGLPLTVDAAYAAAEIGSPSLATAQARAKSAQARVDQARASFLPKVSVGARYGLNGVIDPFDRQDYKYGLSGQVTVSQSLFAGGTRTSQLRQTKADAESSESAVDSTRRGVTQNIANAWNAMVTSQRNVESGMAAASSTAQAFQGMQIEYRADQRSTYELLNAESSLYSTQLNLLNAEHDQYLASARLLGVMGSLEAANLVPQLRIYEPTSYLNRVKGIGFLPTGYVAQVLDAGGLPARTVAAPAPIPQSGEAPALRPAQQLPAPDAPLTSKIPTMSGK